MSGIYLTDMLDVIRDAGGRVGENSITAGWQTRSRSSGGFPQLPVCVFWHHTASNTSVESDLTWQIKTCQDRPVGNGLLDRSGIFWPVAAGASNCAGKGGPMNFSRGQCPQDQGNTHGFNIECQSDGVGQPWSVATIDAYFLISNAMNARFGNQPTDITSHALGAGDGYTDRKIDPATASAVLGPWQPRSTNSSGTWSLGDMRSECLVRAGQIPPPQPGPGPGPTPPPAGQWWNSLMESLPVLRQGSSGIQVKKMQHLLAAVGAMNEANTSNYDGQFGSGTANALNQFKTSAGGGADGICDSWTWGALMHTVDGIPTLRLGDRGPDVKRMQHLLAACGFMNEANVGNYDGIWQSGTDAAKQKFDVASGLTPSPPTDCGQGSWTALLT